MAPNANLMARVVDSFHVNWSGTVAPDDNVAAVAHSFLSPLGSAASLSHESVHDHSSMLAEIRSSGTSSPTSLSMPGLLSVGAAGADGTVHAITTDVSGGTTTTRVLDMTLGTETSTHEDFRVSAALADGAVVGVNNTTGMLETRAATGEVLESASLPVSSARAHVAGRLWVGVTHQDGGVSGYLGPAMVLAQSSAFPWLEAPWEPAVNATASVQNFRSEPIVYKFGDCMLGFGEAPAAPGPGRAGYVFAPVDGVKPMHNRWNVDDWFKVPDLASVTIPTSPSMPPEAHGWSTTLMCRQDDPNQPDYPTCWGRREEPHWSSPGGLGNRDWAHPPIVARETICAAEPRWKFWKRW